jgi:hypothetical protein
MNIPQNRRHHMIFFRNYLLALLVFNLAACSSMQPVSVEDAMRHSPPRGVDYGSMVEIKTLDKRSAKFRVTDINADGLGGSSGFYRYEDMASLKVENAQYKKDKHGNTAAYILGALGVAALIALIANADSVSVCSQPPCLEQ